MCEWRETRCRTRFDRKFSSKPPDKHWGKLVVLIHLNVFIFNVYYRIKSHKRVPERYINDVGMTLFIRFTQLTLMQSCNKSHLYCIIQRHVSVDKIIETPVTCNTIQQHHKLRPSQMTMRLNQHLSKSSRICRIYCTTVALDYISVSSAYLKKTGN